MKGNIRSRLSYQFTLIVALILLFFSISIYYFSSIYRESEFSSRLENKALNTAKFLLKVKEIDYDLLKIIDRNTIQSLYDERVEIYDGNNQMVYSNQDFTSTMVTGQLLKKIRSNKKILFPIDKNEAIGLSYSIHDQKFVVIASAYDKYGRNKLNYLKWILIFVFPISVGCTFFIGRIFSDRALKPMSNVVNQVGKITISNMDLRVDEGNGTDEIAQLAITFNKMLGRLKSAFEMQKSFVSNASHELRTPLTSITGQIEVSLMKTRSQEEYISILQSVLEDIKNLNELSNGLLDLAKASSDISEISMQKLRIDELLWETRSDLIRRKSDYTVSIEYKEQLDDENNLLVIGNEHLLKTAIVNLMDNGCKYSPDKNVKISISIHTKYIRIEFEDHGIGIAENDIPKIFDPFFRASNAQKINGNGLGLSLTDKIVRIHGGSMEILTALNKGTIMSILLPITS